MDTTPGSELRERFPNPRYQSHAAAERVREVYWNIDPSAGLFLGTDVAENSEQFAEVFRQAWMSVDGSDREAIVAAWTVSSSMLYPWVPSISMSEKTSWPAECTNGIFLMFNSRVVANMPNELVLPLIGHELGHTWHYLLKTPSHSRPLRDRREWQEREDDANAIARKWRLRVDDLMAWSNEHRELVQSFVTEDVSSGW
jgi:hypothetical protein